MSRPVDEATAQVDTYLDELLASRLRSLPAKEVPSAELAHAAALLRDALVRFHPSFHFEEELAARLRAVAAGTIRAASLVRFPTPAGAPLATEAPTRADATEPAGPLLPALTEDRDPAVAASAERGWVLLGGAIASGVSLAAGVLLARRRARADGRWERLA